MLGLQPLHIAVIVGLALLVFGPARIPELARALGRAIVEFKQATASIEDDLHKGLEDKPAARIAEEPGIGLVTQEPLEERGFHFQCAGLLRPMLWACYNRPSHESE